MAAAVRDLPRPQPGQGRGGASRHAACSRRAPPVHRRRPQHAHRGAAPTSRAARGACQVAIASRAVPGSTIDVHQPGRREMMGRIYNRLVQLLVLPGLHDTHAASRCSPQRLRMALLPSPCAPRVLASTPRSWSAPAATAGRSPKSLCGGATETTHASARSATPPPSCWTWFGCGSGGADAFASAQRRLRGVAIAPIGSGREDVTADLSAPPFTLDVRVARSPLVGLRYGVDGRATDIDDLVNGSRRRTPRRPPSATRSAPGSSCMTPTTGSSCSG